MKYFIYLITIFFFIICQTYSQQYEDVVYLKNGSIIHGTIIEQVPNESIKIKTKDGNIFVYKMEEIEKMTKEKTDEEKKEEIKKEKKKQPPSGRGFLGSLSPGYNIPFGNFGKDYTMSLDISASFGYLFSSKLGALLTVEYATYNDSRTVIVEKYPPPSNRVDSTRYDSEIGHIFNFRAEFIGGSINDKNNLIYFGKAGAGGNIMLRKGRFYVQYDSSAWGQSWFANSSSGWGAEDFLMNIYAGAGIGYRISSKFAVCLEIGYVHIFSDPVLSYVPIKLSINLLPTKKK